MVSLQDFEDYATKFMSRGVLEFYRSGAQDEQTLHDNQQAFKRWMLHPRILRDVSVLDLTTSVLGQQLPLPFAIAPTGLHGLAHPDGELATARAAASMGVGMILSTMSSRSIEEVAEAAGPSATLWFQFYILKDMEANKQMIRRVERAGYKGIFVTVDLPCLGKRLGPIRSNFHLPQHVRLANIPTSSVTGHKKGLEYMQNQIDPSLSWKHIKWLKSFTTLPIVLKGILTGEAAKEAVAHGVAGILVSNHGGRQLDGVPATIDALPEVVEAVRGSDIEVYMDGGVRLGTDILKALALGARAVFIGQPTIWALSYGGEAGVKKMLQILKDEFRTAMALVGATSLSSIDRSLVRSHVPSLL